MELERNFNGMELEWNGIKIKMKQMDDDCVGDGAIEQSASTSFVVMACIKEKRCFFPSTSCFLKIIFFFFFFFFHQSYYKGYSLHDYKLKNTQECTTQMLTSKPM
jgi:hypothetical protein